MKNKIDDFKKDPHVRKLVQEHSTISALSSIKLLTGDWLVIMGSIFLCEKFFHPLTYLLTVIIIATRQHGLLVIMHEGAHYRLFRNRRLNDIISDMLAAFPTLFSTQWYRQHHLTHHRYTNTEQDPDWVRKIPLKEWQFPQSSKAIKMTLWRQLFVGGLQWIQLTAMISKNDRAKIIYWSLLLGTILTLGLGKEFFLYWMAPLLTLFPLIQRIRSLSEHFGLPNEHELNETRNILAHPVERFFFSPHNVNLHLVHHLFPSVPQHRLVSLHQALLQHPIYQDLGYYNDGFVFGTQTVWQDLCGEPALTRQKHSA